MPVHINGCFSPPHPVFNFSWTIRCESGDRNVQWGIEWQGSNHRKNCVCLDVCMSPKPCQWCGPSGGAGHDWGGHCVKTAVSGAIRSMLPCLAPGAVLGTDTGISECGGAEEGHVPTTEPPSSSAWRGREVRNISSIWLYQAGPSFPPQDKGL